MQATTIKRPKFSEDQIDYTAPDVQRLISSYCDWLDDCNEGSSDEECISDIKKVFERISRYGIYTDDGFSLVKYMEDHLYLIGDSNLVEIINDAPDIAQSHHRAAIRDWIDENNLIIPENIIGSKCITDGRYKGMYVVGIRGDEYKVVLNENQNKTGGYIVEFESLQFE